MNSSVSLLPLGMGRWRAQVGEAFFEGAREQSIAWLTACLRDIHVLGRQVREILQNHALQIEFEKRYENEIGI